MDTKRTIVIDTPPKTFSTHDLYAAAYMIVAGAKLVGRTKSGFKTVFEFSHENLDDLVNGWIDGTATVSAQSYAQKILMLKGILCSERGGRDVE